MEISLLNLAKLDRGHAEERGGWGGVWRLGKQLHWEMGNDSVSRKPRRAFMGAYHHRENYFFLINNKGFPKIHSNSVLQNPHGLGTGTEEDPSGTRLSGFGSFHPN